MINIINVFSLFDSESMNNRDVKEVDKPDFTNHPYVLLGFFTKMILRGDLYNTQLTNIASGETKVDTQALHELNKLLIYNRAYEYLQRLDLDNQEHLECILEKADGDFLIAAGRALEFYTSIEHYEKCAVIKKVQDFVKFSQKKLPL